MLIRKVYFVLTRHTVSRMLICFRLTTCHTNMLLAHSTYMPLMTAVFFVSLPFSEELVAIVLLLAVKAEDSVYRRNFPDELENVV